MFINLVWSVWTDTFGYFESFAMGQKIFNVHVLKGVLENMRIFQ